MPDLFDPDQSLFAIDGTAVVGWDLFSDDRRYRYRLRYIWDQTKPVLGCCGQNPSKATRSKTDGTVIRMIRRAMRGGYGGFEMMNLGAFVSTDPEGFFAAEDPIGPECDQHLETGAQQCAGIVVAWGGDHRLTERAAAVERMLLRWQDGLLCLGRTATGAPRHPSRLGYAVQFERW